jgi:curved DNA-binding protein CbpA
MDQDPALDYYEVLQISTTAEPETVHRVYRLLAQRFHPDNREVGSESRFRQITEAYHVLGDPERRARYDLVHERQQRDRWRIVERSGETENDFAAERRLRLGVLEILYSKRRVEPETPGLSPLDLERMTGRAREHLEFTLWYLAQKKFVARSDNSMVAITADGMEHLEERYESTPQTPRLRAVNE